MFCVEVRIVYKQNKSEPFVDWFWVRICSVWDRLKKIDVEPDLNVWKEYAYLKNLHPSILSYLEIEKQNFYRVESTVDGKTFITARGWEDLSQMIRLYEMHDIKVDEKLVSQYVQNPKVCKSFSVRSCF